MAELTKKHKTYSMTHYYRGIELAIICVTTSKKKFAEIINQSLSHVNKYANSYDLRYQICNENPEIPFAIPGIGGEAMFIFKRGEIKTLEEYQRLIIKHREIYPTHIDYTKTQNLFNERNR